MNIKKEKGGIAIFVLVTLLFMVAFLIIAFAGNVNKSKATQEQFDIISGIYSLGDGEENSYERAYAALRRKNKQTMVASSENVSNIELRKTYAENLSNYRIYGYGKDGRILPDGYQELDYIESTGTQYIDTGIIVDYRNTIEIQYTDFKLEDTFSHALFDSRVIDTKNVFTVYVQNNSNSIGFRGNNNGYGDLVVCRDVSTAMSGGTFIYSPEEIKFTSNTGERIYTGHKYNDFTTVYPLRLFAYYDLNRFSSYKLRKFVISLDNTEILNFIPALDHNGVTCLYDTVTKKTFYNSGTGEFLAGNTNGVGDMIRDTSNAHYGKYKIPIKLTNAEGESITKEIFLDKPLYEGDYIDFITKNVIRSNGDKETIELPEISMFEDYTKIEILTEIKPSKVEVEYTGYTLD